MNNSIYIIMNNTTRDGKHCDISEVNVVLAIQPKCIHPPTWVYWNIYLNHSTNDTEPNFVCNIYIYIYITKNWLMQWSFCLVMYFILYVICVYICYMIASLWFNVHINILDIFTIVYTCI